MAAKPRSVARGSKAKDGKGSFLELVIIVVVALGLALGIQQFIVKPFRIPSESMVPTLTVGQRVLVDRVSPHFTSPERGDIVVFKPPKGADGEDVTECGAEPAPGQPCPAPTKGKSDQNFIKRVVGLPGDKLSVRNGQVYINGKLNDPFKIDPASCEEAGSDTCDLPQEITIPPDHFFMMGDNRGNSDDSRKWGPVPEDWVIGGAFFTYWPPKRIGKL
jgi:signal peptidase I